MGLDMYLSKKLKGKDQDGYQNKEEIGYWRKANHIHSFFVENAQNGQDDCKPYKVTKEQLEDLKQKCEQIMALKKTINTTNGMLVKNILPAAEGFFFGDSNYDDYYFQETKATIEICDKTLKILEKEPKAQIFYQSSW